MEATYAKLGLEYRSGLAMIGSKAKLTDAGHKVRVAVMDELDDIDMTVPKVAIW